MCTLTHNRVRVHTQVAADEMDLRLEEPQLKALLQFLDVRGVGSADPDAWAAVMSDADYDDVLRHRVDLDAFPHKTRRQRDLMEREAELLQEGGWDLPDRGVDVDAFTHKTPLTAEYAAQAQEIAATEEDMVRRQLELLRMQEELLRKEEGLLLEAARTGETPPLSAEQGQHEEHGRLEDFDEFSGPAYQPVRVKVAGECVHLHVLNHVTTPTGPERHGGAGCEARHDGTKPHSSDHRNNGVLLQMLPPHVLLRPLACEGHRGAPTCEDSRCGYLRQVTEDGSLTKADARYLNTLVREEVRVCVSVLATASRGRLRLVREGCDDSPGFGGAVLLSFVPDVPLACVRMKDARLVEGFNAANGDRQVFFDTVLTDVLQVCLNPNPTAYNVSRKPSGLRSRSADSSACSICYGLGLGVLGCQVQVLRSCVEGPGV